MGKKNKQNQNIQTKNEETNKKYPFVTLCTPTFNRRPFIPIMLKCFEQQTYPKDRIEWLIVDDGTDKIEDMVKDVPQIKYFKYDEKMTLGKKRNLLNDNSKGDIIIFIDDDDYYPPERITHAVETLQKNPKALCAGSSEMFIFFKHINKMYKFGPYGPNHATAATFAFKKELLKITRFNEASSVAEEKQFLKDYTIPFVQLDSRKSILVFSHIHNSFDKKVLLNQPSNPTVNESKLIPTDFVNNNEILNFFMNEIDGLLNAYQPGNPINKPDVIKQLEEMKKSREAAALNQQKNPQFIIQQLANENAQLKDKIQYLEKKIRELINDKIQERLKTHIINTQVVAQENLT